MYFSNKQQKDKKWKWKVKQFNAENQQTRISSGMLWGITSEYTMVQKQLIAIVWQVTTHDGLKHARCLEWAFELCLHFILVCRMIK